MLSTKANALLDTLITQMADALISSRTDLHDERQVLRALVGAGFAAGDAITLSDQVIASARAKSRAHWPISKIAAYNSKKEYLRKTPPTGESK